MVKSRTRSLKRQEQPFLSGANSMSQALQPRSFGTSMAAASLPQSLNLKLDLKKSQQYGHHPDRISVFSGDQASAQGTPKLQRKLSFGKPQDPFEQQADQQADRVTAHLNDAVVLGEELTPRKRRRDDESALSPITAEAQPAVQTQSDAQVADQQQSDLEAGIAEAEGGGDALAEEVRQPMERSFGAKFDQVRVHTDARSHQMNRQLGARAFTTQQDIFFRQGEYNPGSRSGQKLLAHELTHVVQQTGGGRSSRPSVQPKLLQCAYLSNTAEWKTDTTSKKFGRQVGRQKLAQVDRLLAAYSLISGKAQKQELLRQLLVVLNQVKYLTASKTSASFKKRQEACDKLRQEVLNALPPTVVAKPNKASAAKVAKPAPAKTTKPSKKSPTASELSDAANSQIESVVGDRSERSNDALEASQTQVTAEGPTPTLEKPTEVENQSEDLGKSDSDEGKSDSEDPKEEEDDGGKSDSEEPQEEGESDSVREEDEESEGDSAQEEDDELEAKSAANLDPAASKSNKERVKYHLLKSVGEEYKEDKAEGRAGEQVNSLANLRKVAFPEMTLEQLKTVLGVLKSYITDPNGLLEKKRAGYEDQKTKLTKRLQELGWTAEDISHFFTTGEIKADTDPDDVRLPETNPEQFKALLSYITDPDGKLQKLRESYANNLKSVTARLQGIGWAAEDVNRLVTTGESKVEYLEEEDDRSKYALHLGSPIKQGKSPEPYDTTSMYANGLGAGHGIFVMSPDGQFYGGAHKVSLFHHSSFLAGGDAASAGTMKVEQGTLKEISNKTGHYKAGDDQLTQALMELEAQGVSLSGVTVKLASSTGDILDQQQDAQQFLTRSKTGVQDKNKLKTDFQQHEKSLSEIGITWRGDTWVDWETQPVPREMLKKLLSLTKLKTLKDQGYSFTETLYGGYWTSPGGDVLRTAEKLLQHLKSKKS